MEYFHTIGYQTNIFMYPITTVHMHICFNEFYLWFPKTYILVKCILMWKETWLDIDSGI